MQIDNCNACLNHHFKDEIWKGFQPSSNSTINEDHIIINTPYESPMDDSHCRHNFYYDKINPTAEPIEIKQES